MPCANEMSNPSQGGHGSSGHRTSRASSPVLHKAESVIHQDQSLKGYLLKIQILEFDCRLTLIILGGKSRHLNFFFLSSERFIAGPSKENGWLMVRNHPQPLDDFQGRVSIGKIWCGGCRVRDFLLIGWWGSKQAELQEFPAPSICIFIKCSNKK